MERLLVFAAVGLAIRAMAGVGAVSVDDRDVVRVV